MIKQKNFGFFLPGLFLGTGAQLAGGLFGGGGGGSQRPPNIDIGAFRQGNQRILDQFLAGPSQQQRQMTSQLTNQLFNQGAEQIQEQANRLISSVGGSAAARGLGQSSIGLGGATAIGRRSIDQLARLRGGLNANALQSLMNQNMQAAQLGMQGQGQLASLLGQQFSGQNQQYAAEQQARGQQQAGLFGALGTGLGALLG